MADVTELVVKSCSADEEEVRRKYGELVRRLTEKGLTLTAMESCTAGQIASLITDTEGSSAVFRGSFVTYSNDAKIKAGVPKRVISEYGVYSAETAAAMAQVCRSAFDADFAVGVTGTFGNADPNNSDSRVGEVCFAIAVRSGTSSYHCAVPAQPSRHAYKLFMADIIADILLGEVNQ